MNFEGKIALVTGANRGIGRAISEMLANQGAIVIGTATTITGVEIITEYLGNNGKGMKLNVSIKESIDELFQTISKEYNSIDILINNAGIINDDLLICMKEDKWKSVLNTNLTSVYYMSKYAIRMMLKKKYGKIVTIGSVVGNTGNIGQTNYSASKAGIIGFSKSVALEVASRGITVNVVSPGFIETDLTKTLTDAQRIEILSRIPIGYFGNSKHVANVVIFLVSDNASYITGETIHVNGGMYMS